MSRFKVGDRVEIITETGYSKPYLQKGQRGTITAVGQGCYVKMDEQVQHEEPWYLGFTEIKPVEAAGSVRAHVTPTTCP
jgi:hypothetical protein